MDLQKNNPFSTNEQGISKIPRPLEKIRPHDHNGADAPQVRFSRLRFDNYQLPTAYGGTGASAVSAARVNLGLAIGTDVQAWDVALDDLAGITLNTGDIFMVSASGHIVDLAIGSTDQVLTVSATGYPAWKTTSSSSTPRRNLNVQLNTTNGQKSGATDPTDSTTVNGVQCSTPGVDGGGSILKINSGAANSQWDFYDKNPEINIDVDYSAGSATGEGRIWFGDTADTTPPAQSQVSKGMFVMADTVAGVITWYAVNATGAANTNTALTGITSAQQNYWRIIKNSTTNIKFYCNNVLKATHTTNLPSGDCAATSWFTLGIDNDTGDTTTRTARFGYCDVLIDSPTG